MTRVKTNLTRWGSPETTFDLIMKDLFENHLQIARMWTTDLLRYKHLPGFKEFELQVEGFETLPMRYRVFAVYDTVDNAVYARLST